MLLRFRATSRSQDEAVGCEAVRQIAGTAPLPDAKDAIAGTIVINASESRPYEKGTPPRPSSILTVQIPDGDHREHPTHSKALLNFAATPIDLVFRWDREPGIEWLCRGLTIKSAGAKRMLQNAVRWAGRFRRREFEQLVVQNDTQQRAVDFKTVPGIDEA
jgi:hypothetical protein